MILTGDGDIFQLLVCLFISLPAAVVLFMNLNFFPLAISTSPPAHPSGSFTTPRSDYPALPRSPPHYIRRIEQLKDISVKRALLKCWV